MGFLFDFPPLKLKGGFILCNIASSLKLGACVGNYNNINTCANLCGVFERWFVMHNWALRWIKRYCIKRSL
jgi:hypothetical protein